MDNIFNYLGAFYLIVNIHRLYKTIYPSKERHDKAKEFFQDFSEIIPNDTSKIDKSVLDDTKRHLKKASFYNLYKLLISIVYLIWIIVGCNYHPQTNLFVIMLIATTISFVAPMIYSIMLLFADKKELGKAMLDSFDAMDKAKWIDILVVSVAVIKIMATAFIIYPYFF